MVYVHQPTGTGKSYALVEMGHDLAKDLLPTKGKATIKVILVVMAAELVGIFQRKFLAKQAQADMRIEFQWMCLDTFRASWHDKPEVFAKSVILVDEGDEILRREILHCAAL